MHGLSPAVESNSYSLVAVLGFLIVVSALEAVQLPGCGSLLMTVSLIVTVQWDIGNQDPMATIRIKEDRWHEDSSSFQSLRKGLHSAFTCVLN